VTCPRASRASKIRPVEATNYSIGTPFRPTAVFPSGAAGHVGAFSRHHASKQCGSPHLCGLSILHLFNCLCLTRLFHEPNQGDKRHDADPP
jgi:hypothetical protein